MNAPVSEADLCLKELANIDWGFLLINFPSPLFVKDTDGRYTTCNHAFTDMFGLTLGQIRGKRVYDIWPSELAQICHEHDIALLNQKTPAVYETKIKHQNGDLRSVIFYKTNLLQPDGTSAGLLGLILDASQREAIAGEWQPSVG